MFEKDDSSNVQNGYITKNGVLSLFTLMLFQFENFLQKVDLMYQLSSCPNVMNMDIWIVGNHFT